MWKHQTRPNPPAECPRWWAWGDYSTESPKWSIKAYHQQRPGVGFFHLTERGTDGPGKRVGTFSSS